MNKQGEIRVIQCFCKGLHPHIKCGSMQLSVGSSKKLQGASGDQPLKDVSNHWISNQSELKFMCSVFTNRCHEAP